MQDNKTGDGSLSSPYLGTYIGRKLLPFDDGLAKDVLRVSRTDKIKKIKVPEAVRRRVLHAIVLIHNEARYFEGMAILAGIAGWKPRVLENEFDSYTEQKVTRDKFNAWVKKMSGAE